MTTQKIFEEMSAAFWRDFRRWAFIAAVWFSLAGAATCVPGFAWFLLLVPGVLAAAMASMALHSAEDYRELARMAASAEDDD